MAQGKYIGEGNGRRRGPKPGEPNEDIGFKRFNKGKGGNRYTAFHQQKLLRPDLPAMIMIAGVPTTITDISQLKAKRGPNKGPRKDKGKKRQKRGEMQFGHEPNLIVGGYDCTPVNDEDLIRTLEDIAKFNKIEEFRQLKSIEDENFVLTPAQKHRRKLKRLEYMDDLRARKVKAGIDPRFDFERKAEERRKLLPANLTCPCCGITKWKPKQWVIAEFADGVKSAICRVCFDSVRFKRFAGDAAQLREWLKCVKYGEIGKSFMLKGSEDK